MNGVASKSLTNKKTNSFLYRYLTINTFILIILSLSGSFAQTNINHWETAIYAEDEWKYQTADTDPGDDWMHLNFTDSEWQSGSGGIGYGDGDDNTIVPTTLAVFLRKSFEIPDISKIARAIVHIDYDDAFIAYINGIEFARSAGLTSIEVNYNTPAAFDSEAIMYQGQTPNSYEFNVELLVEGTNVFAFEVHNVSLESSDLSAIAYLSFGINDSSSFFGETPDWFNAPTDFTESNLPIFIINTLGVEIPNDPKITAELKVIYNGIGEINNITDSANEYNGYIGIETRGESSQYFFPKKSYGFETRLENGENNNVSLLGMPEENDWILYAPYSDKTLMRNVMTYDLSNTMGQYCTRTHYCEVIVNSDYKGIYVLLEKIKRDNNRVDIDRLSADENSGDEITGGYIIRVDKTDDINFDTDGWYSQPNPTYPNAMDIYFQYYSPDAEAISVEQKQYIQDYILEFEESLISTDFDDSLQGYYNYIDVKSFANTLLINELAKDIDVYRFSNFFYKDKNSNGGKLVSGPFWDYNLGYGNVDYGSEGAQYTDDWLYNIVEPYDWSRMFWWKRLMEDSNFQDEVKTQWTNLRTNSFSNENIEYRIDSISAYLFDARERNYERWDIIGLYVWPNFYVGNTYNEDFDYFKDWVIDRADWLDENIPGENIINFAEKNENNLNLNVFPNPFVDQVTFSFSDYEDISSIIISDLYGRRINTLFSDEHSDIFTWNIKNEEGKSISSGIYVFSVISENSIIQTGRIIKL